MTFVQSVEAGVAAEAKAVYGRLVAFVEDDVEPFLKAEEAALVALVKPILQAGEKQAMAALSAAAETFVRAAGTARSLGDLEADFLNALETAEPELLELARAVGSQVLQGVLGLVVAKLATLAGA